MRARSAPHTESGGGRLAVFRNYNFTLFWTGSVISNSGSWMQQVAQGYLVYDLSDSPFMLGLIGVARAIPFITLAPFGGVVADRVERVKLLKLTQTVQMLLALLQAVLISLGIVEIWQIAAIGFFSSLVNSFDQPTRSAILPDMVRGEDLAKAIALNSSAWQGAALFGPTLAGIVIAGLSVEAAFYANAISFLFVIGALYAMRGVPERSNAPSNKSFRGDFVAGLRYVKSSRFVLCLLLISAITSLSGRSYQQLLPAFAKSVLHEGPRGLGFMMAAPGLGTVIGTATLATMNDVRYKGRAFLLGMFLLSASLVAFSFNRSFPIALVLLFATGAASLLFSTMMTTMLQLEVSPAMRGRIMALVAVSFQGVQPLGSMITGGLATLIGIPQATFIAALTVGVVALLAYTSLPAIRKYKHDELEQEVAAWPQAGPVASKA